MDKEVKLGDGVASELKKEFNSELSSAGKKLIQTIFKYLCDKVQDVDFDDLLKKSARRMRKKYYPFGLLNLLKKAFCQADIRA